MNAEAVAETQAAPQVTTPEAPKSDVIKQDAISPKLQMLVQREKRAVEIERAAKQKEAEIEAKFKEISDREARIKEFESLKSENPLKALELLGLSYQDLTGVALNDGAVPPEVQVRKVEEKLDSYVKAQEAAERERAESAQRMAKQQEEKVIIDFKSEINTFIDSDPKAYELIKFEGLEDLVFDTIDENYNRTQKVMSIKEAADKVEQMLEKKYDEAKKLNKLKQSAPDITAQLIQQQKISPNQLRPMTPNRTLTNKLSATPTAPRTRPLTDDDRVAKAIAYAKGLRP